MKRALVSLAALAGLALTALGVVAALLVDTGRVPTADPWVLAGALCVGLVSAAVAVWKIRGSLGVDSERPVTWVDDDPFASPAPERSNDTYPLSSDWLSKRILEAGTTARSEGSVDDGLAVIRPVLREALLDAVEWGTGSREDALRELEAGTWTDDPVAASVLDASVAPPERSFRERLEAWLFPERVVHRRTQRAVQAVAEAADDVLPTVPGQRAPRPVPVLQPRLEDLWRGADGKLQRAVDPDVVARGPEPVDAGSDDATDPETADSTDSGTADPPPSPAAEEVSDP